MITEITSQSNQSYIKSIEQQMVSSLIYQFNRKIGEQAPNQRAYKVALYAYRPAGFTDLSNVRAQFIDHCQRSGWFVDYFIINECIINVRVISKSLKR